MSNDEFIYETPAADLTKKEELPAEFIGSDLTSKKLRLAGWLSIIYMLLLIPSIWASSMVAFQPENENYDSISKIFMILNLVLWTYLFLIFKTFINSRFGFYGANTHITVLILLSIILSAISMFMDANTEALSVSMIAYFVLMLPYGVMTVLFGKKLLMITIEYKHLKLFSWINIISGVLIASVVFFMLSLPLGFVSSLLMALIFFNAAKEIDNTTHS
jgi:hypothetical protein